ncbi:MAG: glycosyl hydrolase [Pirellulaceae bacterium]
MHHFTRHLLLAVLPALAATQVLPAAETSAPLRAMFAQPPREYATGPLWNWNDLLTQEQVVSTLRDLAAQHVRQVWVHPQPGLMTPYLSDDWFRLWKIALDEAKKLGMNIWMYDENSYPSGFAGGYVPESMPESRGRGLHFRAEKAPGPLTPDVLAVFQLSDSRGVDVTGELRAGQTLPEGNYLTAVVARAPNTPWNAGRCYVDLLYPGVTQRFLDITLEPYRQRFAAEFGKQIPGVFTDEPSLLPAGGLPWTDDLPQQFQQRWGYSLLDNLPGLVQPVGDWRRLRHNYFQVLLDLYIERWAKPYFEYCQRNNLEFTGHYLEHEWPTLIHTPDYMALEAWEHRPGIDLLMNQYLETPRAQFGNVRIVKEIGSVANQLARPRTLSETYAGSGHEIRFEEMKRQGDWEFVLGLNTLNECLSQVSMRGVRKGNWPRSLSYHNPWWEAYHVLEDYFTRLSAATSDGRQVNDILVLEPTTTAWMYQNDASLEVIGNTFQALLHDLERSQVEYDLGSEDILARHGSVADAHLVVGACRYRVVVLPPGTENLNARTVELLSSCLKAGGRVFCCGPPPDRIDGQTSAALREAAASAGWKSVTAAELPRELLACGDDGFVLERKPDDGGRLFHQRRMFDDGELLLLVNTATDSESLGTIRTTARGVEQWCLDTGHIVPFLSTVAGEGTTASFQLPPCGSLLLFLTRAPSESPQSASPRVTPATPINPLSPPAVRRLEDNVLVLDYLQCKTADEAIDMIHCREATRRLFTRHGFQGDPWFEAVQFADEHIRRTFSAETAFEVTYQFTIAESVPARLHFVLERPDLYESIACNGQPVTPLALEDNWWLDRAFGKLDIRAAAHVGENVITLKAAQFTVFHELEPAYVLGDFCLQDSEHGFRIVPATALRMDRELGWNMQGHPFYGGGVAYRQDFDVAAPAGRYQVVLTNWFGSVAKVVVNDQPAGFIGWQPWECDVTDWIKPGTNQVEVIVIGTLRNTLGPFHAGAPQGIVTPQMFSQSPAGGQPPGHAYTSIRYGLFEPFVLQRAE